MHECLICKYSTNDKTNLYHHQKSKKHILNVEKNKSEKDNEKELIKIKDDKIEELKQELVKLKQEKDKAIIQLETKV